jgi:predicted phosphodiesterase
MRMAIVSDIHGNRTAFDAVLGDLRQTSPDLIFHGGDLADAGASPMEIVDRIRDLGWPGVVGNTDEMLFRPESLREFAKESEGIQALLPMIEEMAEATRELLGTGRLAWLSGLPRSRRFETFGPLALLHASPESLWRAPSPEASDADLAAIYETLGKPVVVYAHIHKPFLRKVPGIRNASENVSAMVIANTGSVGLSYDGDRRGSYLLLDEDNSFVKTTIRRVQYDIDGEIRALSNSGLPHADWIVRMLESGRPQLP